MNLIFLVPSTSRFPSLISGCSTGFGGSSSSFGGSTTILGGSISSLGGSGCGLGGSSAFPFVESLSSLAFAEGTLSDDGFSEL